MGLRWAVNSLSVQPGARNITFKYGANRVVLKEGTPGEVLSLQAWCSRLMTRQSQLSGRRSSGLGMYGT